MAKRVKAIPRFDVKDGGYKSRKLWITVFTMALISGVSILTAKYPAIVAVHSTLVGGLISCLALFLTGNVAASHLTGKNMIASAALGTDPDADAASESTTVKTPAPGAPPPPAQKPAEPRTF